MHAEARRYAGRGLKIALVGHAGHVEVDGTMGEAPETDRPRRDRRRTRANLELEDGKQLAYLTQTTLSLDDTAEVVDALRERFPDLVGPPSADICYATQNRQDAVKKICEEATAGPRRRLADELEREPARRGRAGRVGAEAYLIDDETDLDAAWLEGHETVGLTAGASSPEVLVDRVVERLAELGYAEREEVEIAREDVYFRLPAELR